MCVPVQSLQSLPLMKSSHECEHDVSQSEGILQRSSCTEVHVFRPFSKATSGAVTETVQTLTFRAKSAGVRTRKGEQLAVTGPISAGSLPTPSTDYMLS